MGQSLRLRFADTAQKVWEVLLPRIKPVRVLEIGSFEGASACFVIEACRWSSTLELHCVDTWLGGQEHVAASINMDEIETRFDKNIAISQLKSNANIVLHKHKSKSSEALVKLLADGRGGYFDFIYVDGSHAASDVLSDAILSYKLLRLGGVLAFDDYLWVDPTDKDRNPLNAPKLAIDSFVNVYYAKLEVIKAPLYQIYLRKTAE
jgi:predicted O-methyltransferase YrrM